MSGLRPYDGWWFFGEEERRAAPAAPPKKSDAEGRPQGGGTPPPAGGTSLTAVVSSDHPQLDGLPLSPFPIVAWMPFRSGDNDRLERGLADASFRDVDADEIVVHDGSGQRLSKVSYARMVMSPLYWTPFAPFRVGSYAQPETPVPQPKVPTGVVPVRRAIWMQMAGDDDVLGGAPLAPGPDALVEAAYQGERAWLASAPDSADVVERIVPLDGALAGRVLLLRRGILDSATLLPASVLDDARSANPAYVRKHALRLVRGYMPYHIAVVSAWKAAEAAEKSTAVRLDLEAAPPGDVPPVRMGGGLVPEAGVPPRASKNPALASLLLASPFAEPDVSVPDAPKALVLCVHGIGQKLAVKLGYNFVHDTSGFRDRIITAAAQRHGRGLDEVYVLPVVWRAGLKMTTLYFAEAGDSPEGPVEAHFEDLVGRITLGNIPAIRDMATDVGLDILLYMTPLYFRRILRAALRDIRRIYALFLRVGGRGAERTRVSLVGHSLGAAIVSDLLAFVPRAFPFEPVGGSPHWDEDFGDGADGQDDGGGDGDGGAVNGTGDVQSDAEVNGRVGDSKPVPTGSDVSSGNKSLPSHGGLNLPSTPRHSNPIPTGSDVSNGNKSQPSHGGLNSTSAQRDSKPVPTGSDVSSGQNADPSSGGSGTKSRVGALQSTATRSDVVEVLPSERGNTSNLLPAESSLKRTDKSIHVTVGPTSEKQSDTDVLPGTPQTLLAAESSAGLSSASSYAGLAEQAEHVASNLGFACDCFFAVGSPLAAFLLLKQLKPYGCCVSSPGGRVARTVVDTAAYSPPAEAFDEDESDPRHASAPHHVAFAPPAADYVSLHHPDTVAAPSSASVRTQSTLRESSALFPTMLQPAAREGDVIQPRRIVYACRQMYNVFHPTDPIAYRMEPLIVSADEMRRLQYPVRVPYTKGGVLMLKRQVEESVSRFTSDIVSSLHRSLAVLPAWMRIGAAKSASPEGALAAIEDGAQADDTGTQRNAAHVPGTAAPTSGLSRAPRPSHDRLFRFNRRGRLDYSLEEALFDNAYLSAISSHFGYWDDTDVAHFIASEVNDAIERYHRPLP